MILLEQFSFSAVGAIFFRLPDLPGWVVQVHRAAWRITSWTSGQSASLMLNHNVANNNISVNDLETAWARLNVRSDVGMGDEQVYTPEPYELVGKQSAHFSLSGGTIDGILAIVYGMRREPNRTLWNALRARTSFEKD